MTDGKIELPQKRRGLCGSFVFFVDFLYFPLVFFLKTGENSNKVEYNEKNM